MVIALDAGNTDDSNGDETDVFVFHDKHQRENRVTTATFISSQASIFFLLPLHSLAQSEEATGLCYVSEHLTLYYKHKSRVAQSV